jgi:transcriptional regulator with XRE-family HTH domain
MHKGSESFGALLQDFRGRLGMTQNALARAAGVNVGTVNRIEHDQRLPAGRDQALALAGALGLGMAESNRLLAAADLPAEGFGPAITTDPLLCRLAVLLQDPALPPAVHAALMAVIENALLLAGRGHDDPAGV